MNKNLIKKSTGMIKTIAFLIATVCAVNTAAIAELVENPLDGIQVCAAVYPCGENYELLKEFSVGDCASVYAEQCNIAAQSGSRNMTASLKTQNRVLNNRVSNLRKEILRLKSQLQRTNHTNAQLRARLAAAK